MAKASKSMGTNAYKHKPKKKGQASKTPGPKSTPMKTYRGQGR